jgi:hypothetical protein
MAAENPTKWGNLKYWRGVKVLAPPAGDYWEYAIKILGIYDNIPVGQRMSFADNMAFLRREYETKYMPLTGEGGFKDPEGENKKLFRKEVQTVLGLASAGGATTAAVGLLARSNTMYDLVRKVLTGDVKPAPEPFNPLGGAMTLYVFAQLPDEICIELLEQVVERKITVQQAGSRAKELKEIAMARDFIMQACRTKYTKRTKQWKTWKDFVDEWPKLDGFADQCKGYFARAGRKRLELDGLKHQINLLLEDLDKQEEEVGSEQPVAIDPDILPFLLVGIDDEKVFVAAHGAQYFVLLNCTTESASKYISAREYGNQLFLTFCFVLTLNESSS